LQLSGPPKLFSVSVVQPRLGCNLGGCEHACDTARTAAAGRSGDGLVSDRL